MHHACQIAPSVRSRVPGNRAGADGEVDVAACKQPSAVVGSGGGSGAARRQISDCGPSVRGRIVAPGLVRGGIAAARVNIVTERGCHQAVIGKRVVCSHRPAICRNVVNLDVKIGANSATGDAVDFAVEISRGMKVGGNSIGWQARVVGVADRIVPPKRGRRVEVLIHAAEQVDIGAVGCAAEPAARLRKRRYERPSVLSRRVLVSVGDRDVVNDATEAIDIASY